MTGYKGDDITTTTTMRTVSSNKPKLAERVALLEVQMKEAMARLDALENDLTTDPK